MGKQSRRKRERRESAESAAFRRHLTEEHLCAMIAEHPGVDWESLHKVGFVQKVIVDGARSLPLVAPLSPPADHSDFDRAVCAAGLREYFRGTLPSDQPGHGTPINPETRQPDPSIPVPTERFGPHVRVVELAPGIRVRRDEAIAML